MTIKITFDEKRIPYQMIRKVIDKFKNLDVDDIEILRDYEIVDCYSVVCLHEMADDEVYDTYFINFNIDGVNLVKAIEKAMELKNNDLYSFLLAYQQAIPEAAVNGIGGVTISL